MWVWSALLQHARSQVCAAAAGTSCCRLWAPLGVMPLLVAVPSPCCCFVRLKLRLPPVVVSFATTRFQSGCAAVCINAVTCFSSARCACWLPAVMMISSLAQHVYSLMAWGLAPVGPPCWAGLRLQGMRWTWVLGMRLSVVLGALSSEVNPKNPEGVTDAPCNRTTWMRHPAWWMALQPSSSDPGLVGNPTLAVRSGFCPQKRP